MSEESKRIDELTRALEELIDTVAHNLYMNRYARIPSTTTAINRARRVLLAEKEGADRD